VMERYLTPKAKVRVLREFDTHKMQSKPKGELAGKGYPDPEIIPLCDWLNSFDGVCTLQSCAGHRIGSLIHSKGVLWIWLDEKLAAQFRERAFELAMNPQIESVSQVYSIWGEYVAIIFRGNECGEIRTSLHVIQQYFGSLFEQRAIA
jgi:hypothetical protein